MSLMLATPFASYETPYLERWAEAYAPMAEGLEATALWYYNAANPAFAKTLEQYAKAMPIPTRLLWEPLPVLGQGDGVVKNNTVCLAHARMIYELRQQDPEAFVFLLESDVIVPAGGPQRLLEGLEHHPGLGALSGAIPEHRYENFNGTMAWRIRPPEEGPYTVPGSGQVVSWYDPELTKGIELVDAVPFGALMAPLSVFEKVHLQATLFPGLGHDQEWSVNAWKAGYPVAVDWSVACGHFRRDYDPAYEDLRKRMTTVTALEVGLL